MAERTFPALQNFEHIFIENGADKTLFLLHGTGGDERDLLPLVDSLRGKYNFVGLRGNVSEQGMLRFFRRTAPGKFDQENIAEETGKLAEFLKAWFAKYSLNVDDVAFMGYSNGANMILAMLFSFPELIADGVLLHAMLPSPPPKLDLKGKKFLITYGENDQMIPQKESLQVFQKLNAFGAEVSQVSHSGGHEIQRDEVLEAVKFLQQV